MIHLGISCPNRKSKNKSFKKQDLKKKKKKLTYRETMIRIISHFSEARQSEESAVKY